MKYYVSRKLFSRQEREETSKTYQETSKSSTTGYKSKSGSLVSIKYYNQKCDFFQDFTSLNYVTCRYKHTNRDCLIKFELQ